MAFSAAECRDVNLCLVHRENASERTEREKQTQAKTSISPFFSSLFFFFLSYSHTESLIFSYPQRPSGRQEFSFSCEYESILFDQTICDVF